MSPRRKTTGILSLAGGVIIAALLFTHASQRARAVPRGPNSASAGGLALSANLESTHVLVGDHETHMALTLTAPTVAGTRPPLHLAIVLDRSYSMNQDDGMRIVQARQAAIQLVSALTERDRFTVIAYHHEASVLFADSIADARARREAIAAIEDLSPAGETNIADALRLGADQLRTTRMPAGAVSRIVLVSDGEHNVPEVMLAADLPLLAASIAEHGISITTVGVGLDFEEQIMTRIATAGRGNYYFVEDTQRLAALFADEIGRLGQTAATEVRVRLTPAPGVTVLDAYGYPMRQQDGAFVIPVADLNSAEQRKIVLRMRINAARAGTVDIGQVETTFVRVATGQRARAEMTARAIATPDDQLVLRYRDREAVRHIERALAARAIDEATALYEQGQNDQAQQRLSVQATRIEGLGDKEIANELAAPLAQAGGAFAAAPEPTSDGGKRAQKGNRADANDLYMK